VRIVIHSQSFAPVLGGMERFGEDLATWLTEQGCDVTVVTATAASPEADRGRPYRVVRGATAEARARIRHAEAVHVSGLSLRGMGLALAQGQRPVVTHHGYQSVCPTGLVMPEAQSCTADGRTPGPCDVCPASGAQASAKVRLRRAGSHVARANVAVSRYVAQRTGLPRSSVIWNGLTAATLARGSVSSADPGLIGFAGRLVQEKGLDLLLDAMVTLPHARLEVAGDGPMLGAWQARAEALGLGDRVRFLGRMPLAGVLDLYDRSAVVCVPSRWHEPFGYAVAEAMAVGAAVVATPMGAFPELLSDGRGFLAEATTGPALAQCLRRALEDDELRRHAGASARAFAERTLHMDVAGRAYLAVYRS
jgi:glycogen synthase